ncbi:MAG: NADP-dependent malic enzyme [Thermotogae bacterium]|nr:NADP-dependent malic enzyme [Thermotogota bacterium]
MKISKEEVFRYHEEGRPGKLEIVPSKPAETQRDLSLAYTPGVAEVSRAIYSNPDDVYRFTLKANLVAVISDGSAVLGLGDIGPLAAKPVMEGKALLFKRLADVDSIDVEIESEDPDHFINVVKSIAPTFGGINLEDIKAPKCFYIEEKLIELLDIPVFHDDQHGTAIIVLAGLINALELQGKRIEDVKIVILGAGAAGIAIARMLVKYGARKENIRLIDSRGVIYKGRKEGMNPYKEAFAVETDERTIRDALRGADVFIGVSGPNLITAEDIKLMAERPVIFALANPVPEIPYEVATAARPDAIVATGRSDYPNQLNNVLGFPYIFRGALDVRATRITDNMKIAAAEALARLAREDVPESVLKAYDLDALSFGKDYILPKPLDPRLIYWVAPAVAEAAMRDGVARVRVNLEEYREKLRGITEEAVSFTRRLIHVKPERPPRIVFPEGDNETILRVANVLNREGLAFPVLIGDREVIERKIKAMHLDFKHEIVDIWRFNVRPYAEKLWQMRWRKGLALADACVKLRSRGYLGTMLLHEGDVDAMLYGVVHNYGESLRPILEIIKPRKGVKRVAGLYVALSKNLGPLFFADTTVNPEPTAEDLANIAIMASEVAKKFGQEPRVAFVSFSNFGTSDHPSVEKLRVALSILKEKAPNLPAEGEGHADVLLNEKILKELYPYSLFAKLGTRANVIIFPDLNSANISYKVLGASCRIKMIGPILMGLSRPAHIIQKGDDEEAILSLAYYTIAQVLERKG